MERATEHNRNFLKLIVPKIFSLPHNLTHIHVEYSCYIWGKNDHTLFKRRIFLLLPWRIFLTLALELVMRIKYWRIKKH